MQADASEKVDSPSRRGYDRTWERCRILYLHECPLCELCSARGETVPAAEVHHKTPIRYGGSRLDFANLQALCVRCHRSITAKAQKGKA